MCSNSTSTIAYNPNVRADYQRRMEAQPDQRTVRLPQGPSPLQTAMDEARKLLDNMGGNVPLRGLVIPKTNPTAVSDLKNFVGTKIRRP